LRGRAFFISYPCKSETKFHSCKDDPALGFGADHHLNGEDIEMIAVAELALLIVEA